MVWGLLLALPLIVTSALAGPEEVGANPTVTEHRPLGPTWPSQIVKAENSVDPETLPPSKITLTPLFFFAVLVSVTPFTLILPTLTLPKFRELLDTWTSAGTLGVGVGFGVGVGAGVGFNVGTGVGAGVGAVLGVGAGVGAILGVGAGVGAVLGVGAGVGAVLGVGAAVGVTVGTVVGVAVAVGVCVGVPVAVSVSVGVGVAVVVGVGVALGVGVGVALGVAPIAVTNLLISTLPQPVA